MVAELESRWDQVLRKVNAIENSIAVSADGHDILLSVAK